MATTAEMLNRITVPEITPNNRRSILLEGDPGTGKSHNALSMPGKTLVIYADNNRMTLDKFKLQRDDILEVRVREWEDFDPYITNKLKNRELDVENIVLDSADMLFEIAVSRAQGNRQKLGFDEWAKVKDMCRKATFELTQVCRPQVGKRDYNLVVTCKLQDKLNADGVLIKYEPAFQGSFRSKFESYFDLVLLTDNEVQRVDIPGTTTKERKTVCFIRTVPPGNYHKGLKTGSLDWPSRVDSLQDIQDLINKDLK